MELHTHITRCPEGWRWVIEDDRVILEQGVKPTFSEALDWLVNMLNAKGRVAV